MNAMVALLLPAMLGVDFGWDRRADGTIEYIVQVDPDAFAEMQRSGQSISSALPSSLRNNSIATRPIFRCSPTAR